MRRVCTTAVVFATFAFLIPSVSASSAAAQAVVPVNREVEAVVMSGIQFPSWSRLPADGSGSNTFSPTDRTIRDAHYGQIVVPPDSRSGVPVDRVTAFRWDGADWKEVPVQVDQRFPYYLVNNRSSFGIYSRVDEELTYEWDIESWKKVAGTCAAEYPSAALDPSLLKGYPSKDPVPGLDDDDQISLYASDAGPQAPADAHAPQGTVLTKSDQPGFQPRQEVKLVDPLTGAVSYVYLFLTSGGPSFDGSNGYVQYTRDGNADEWIDEGSFAPNDPEILGTSNANYGPNLPGTVCDPDGTVRQSTDRFPRDGMTVSTPRYQVHASGRWMVRTTRVAEPGTVGPAPNYGPDLIDRWKGRAFQQSPDSNISVVGFEDEQVNWEANSALVGERSGPVRAIREIWGADSGTNTTKTEYYYRDFYLFRYHLRVHPIPPDGLYTSWDHNAGAVTRYFNEGMTKEGRPDGVAIDGKNDDVGNIDGTPLRSNTYFDASDPTFGLPLAVFNWEEVSGSNGSLVYMFQLNNVQAAENPAVIPYYRDDSCFDDGTGDDPSPRVRPGEATSDTSAEYRQRPCWGDDPDPSTAPNYSMTGPWRQGCLACHGIHFLITQDTDNDFLQKPTSEVDGQQFIWAVPSTAPANVGEGYANTVKVALTPAVTPQTSRAPKEATQISNTGPTSGRIGQQVTLSARLTNQAGQGLGGKDVRFSLDGQPLGTDTTDANGDAQLTVTLQGPAREGKLTESFSGDADYLPSSTTVGFEVLGRETSISNTGPTSGRVGHTVTLSARLTAEGTGLSNKQVRFYLDDELLGMASTDANGVAQLQVALQPPARDAQLKETFAGDGDYAKASTTVPFQVEARPTVLSLSVSRVAPGKYRGRATLKDAETRSPLGGKNIRFSRNGRLLTNRTTDSTGTATVTFKSRPGALIAADFTGDDAYAKSHAQKKL